MMSGACGLQPLAVFDTGSGGLLEEFLTALWASSCSMVCRAGYMGQGG
jgi:hypothetical protein